MTPENILTFLSIIASTIAIIVFISKLGSKVAKIELSVESQNEKDENRDNMIQELRDEVRKHIYTTETKIVTEQGLRALLEQRVATLERDLKINTHPHPPT